mgnify:CR=1 FL=1
MPVDITGGHKFILCRSEITAADTLPPVTNDAILQGVATVVVIPTEAKGGITHCLVFARQNIAGSTSLSLTVSVLGKPILTTTEPMLSNSDRWYALWQLNNGSSITSTTRTAIAPQGVTSSNTADGTSRLLYAESLGHVSIYDRLTALVTGFSSNVGTVSVGFIFEAP